MSLWYTFLFLLSFFYLLLDDYLSPLAQRAGAKPKQLLTWRGRGAFKLGGNLQLRHGQKHTGDIPTKYREEVGKKIYRSESISEKTQERNTVKDCVPKKKCLLSLTTCSSSWPRHHIQPSTARNASDDTNRKEKKKQHNRRHILVFWGGHAEGQQRVTWPLLTTIQKVFFSLLFPFSPSSMFLFRRFCCDQRIETSVIDTEEWKGSVNVHFTVE